MVNSTKTYEILEYLLPHLITASRYSRRIQPQIASQPSKEADNIFAAALSDADLSIQSFIEVALLAKYPSLRFYGEEHAASMNTKYLHGIEFGGEDELLALLDPIDGTRLYLDQRDDYMILFGLMTPKEWKERWPFFRKKSADLRSTRTWSFSWDLRYPD